MESNQNSINSQQVGNISAYNSNNSSFPRKFPLRKVILLTVASILLIAILGIVVKFAIDYFGLNKPKEITLTYWGAYEDERVMQKIIDDYKLTHPTITIVYEKQDIQGLGKYVDRLKTRIDKGTGPDIYRFHSSWTLQLNKYLSVFPQEVVEATQIDKDYYKTVQRDLSISGGYYGIPLGVDTLALFTNSRMLQAADKRPPDDWFDIAGPYTRDLSVDGGYKIIGLGTYDNIDHAPDIVAMLLLLNGADLNNLDLEENKSKAVVAFDFYNSFTKSGVAAWNKTLDNSLSAFYKGGLAMYLGYSRDIKKLKDERPDLQFEISELPYINDLSGPIKTPVASYWAEGVSSKTKYRKEAFEFLEYLSKPEVLKKINSEREKIGETKLPYPRRSMQQLLENDQLLPFVKQADDARTTFFSADTYDGDTGMITRLNNALGNAIRSLSDKSTSDVVNALGPEVKQILAEYGR